MVLPKSIGSVLLLALLLGVAVDFKARSQTVSTNPLEIHLIPPAAGGNSPSFLSASITNRSSKNINALTLLVATKSTDGAVGPKVVHNEILAFDPPVPDGVHPLGLSPGGSIVSNFGALRDKQNNQLEVSDITVDYVLFKDGSSWGPDSAHSSLRVEGILTGWKTAYSRLQMLMKTGGMTVVERALSNSH